MIIRGLSLTRPWPFAILHLGKRIENRSWKPPKWILGNYIALHAAQSWSKEDFDFISSIAQGRGIEIPSKAFHSHSVIVGVAKVDGFIEENNLFDPATLPEDQGKWFFGPFGWLLSDVVEFEDPVPCTGALSLWEIKPEILKKVRSEYAKTKNPTVTA